MAGVGGGWWGSAAGVLKDNYNMLIHSALFTALISEFRGPDSAGGNLNSGFIYFMLLLRGSTPELLPSSPA